jgi:gliding motility-associated-like protein
MQITVLGKAAQAGPDLTLCSGEKQIIYGLLQPGYQYSWAPASGLSNPAIATPEIRHFNNTSQPVSYQYILKATHTATGCATQDTLNVTVLPQVAKAGPDIEFCSGESRQLGSDPLPGYRYTWQPAAGLSNPTIANPTVMLSHTGTTPQTFTYILLAAATSGGCNSTDTVKVTVLPPLATPAIIGSRSVCPNVRGVVYRITNTLPDITYQWTIEGGIITGGQGSSQILVDWGGTNAAASLSVTASNAANCLQSTNSMLVKINVALATEKPASPLHPDTLCVSGATGIVYEVVNTTGSIYTWGISGNGVILNGQGTSRITVDWKEAGAGKIWVNEQSTTSTDVCFGTSDTLQIMLAPMPESGNLISGSLKVCAGTSHTYSINGFPNSDFIWSVNGGVITGRQGNTVTVSWLAAGTGAISVKEVTEYGCEGKVSENQVIISPIPAPILVSKQVAVCPQLFTGLTYQVAGLPGSVFSWTIIHGQIISSTADSSTITVNWDAASLPAISLTVKETSLQNCSAVLNIPLLYDASVIVFQSVSVQPEDERNIILHFEIKQRPNVSNMFTISRRPYLSDTGEWTVAGTVSQNDTQFTDRMLDTDNQSYEYKIAGKNQCSISLESDFHHSIVLNAAGNEEKELTELNWNSYTGWENGVKAYQIWRKLDDEPDYTLYATVRNSQLSYVSNNAKEGFAHCYRIRAIESEGFESSSWSNEVCIEFEHALFVPNVITPNSDEKNDFWMIKNLELYPEHHISIYNRLGKEVYQTNTYRQNWNGEGLSNGIYYFIIQTRRNNQTLKGWLHVLR